MSFGPQSRGTSCDQVMNGDEHFAAQVAGETITRNDFRYGFMLVGGAQVPAPLAKRERLKETVMDKLIERELLAKEADRLGFVVTDEEVEDQISDAKIIGLGALHTVPRLQKDGKFNYDAFKTFLQYELGLTPKSFVEEQKRELLANRVRDLFRAGVSVSTDEVKTDFVRRNRQVNLEYLRFSGTRFQGDVALTDAEIADYAAKNDAKLRQAYEQKRFVYEKVPEQRKLRQILVKVPKDATPAVEKAAQAKADGLADRLKKGAKATGKEGLTFAELAREASDDTASKTNGGELGWRAKGASNLTGDAEDKLWSAKTDSLVGPLRGTDGFVITKVEGQRNGAVSYDQAKLELAEEKLREERADAKAKAAA
ncbi:MAG: SurA N-terminal domain-containing protein, partial [Haliangium ochraceum]